MNLFKIGFDFKPENERLIDLSITKYVSMKICVNTDSKNVF